MMTEQNSGFGRFVKAVGEFISEAATAEAEGAEQQRQQTQRDIANYPENKAEEERLMRHNKTCGS